MEKKSLSCALNHAKKTLRVETPGRRTSSANTEIGNRVGVFEGWKESQCDWKGFIVEQRAGRVRMERKTGARVHLIMAGSLDFTLLAIGRH
jgi:hypothetical protein